MSILKEKVLCSCQPWKSRKKIAFYWGLRVCFSSVIFLLKEEQFVPEIKYMVDERLCKNFIILKMQAKKDKRILYEFYYNKSIQIPSRTWIQHRIKNPWHLMSILPAKRNLYLHPIINSIGSHIARQHYQREPS